MYLEKIKRPTLLLNKVICQHNISNMAAKAEANQMSLRPHFKTHISAEVARWCSEFGIDKAAVSSLKMAQYFAQAGWKDILVALPVNPREAEEINQLNQTTNLTILLVDGAVIETLDAAIESPLRVMVEIDTGYGRTGISATNLSAIEKLLDQINQSKYLQFGGFQVHNGHTYLKDHTTIANIHNETLAQLKVVRKTFANDFPNLVISLGDTPACSTQNNFEGIDEIRPGNFVFYDLVQVNTGSCGIEDIAVCFAAPIIFKNPAKGTVTVHGGSAHLSKDFITDGDGKVIFGLPVPLTPTGWGNPIKGGKVVALSQEHGTIQLHKSEIEKLNIGDLIGILPAHSCLTANIQPYYLTTDGKKIPTMVK